MKVYYLENKIINIWCKWLKGDMPENLHDYSSYSVIEFDEEYNRGLAVLLLDNSRAIESLPDRFYIDNGQIIETDTDEVVTIEPNPQKEAYKLSQLYGLTHEQLDNIIDNVSNLAEAKEILRKALHVVLYLVKQTKLDV